MATPREKLSARIEQGRGQAPADIVLKNGRFFDLVTGELVKSDIAITGDVFTGTFGEYSGREEIDLQGQIVVPGFIDTHLHIESSMITPFEFDRCVTPRGVTTVICDPHEIANVAGRDGIQYFLDCALRTVLDIRVQLSSCVPSTHMETAGAELLYQDLEAFKDHPKVIGLAEFMNFPGVLHQLPEVMDKLEGFYGQHIDGHCPLLRGKDLNGYISAGIRTEHEATTYEEALEKLRKGMHVLIREGSVSKDLKALTPLITERHSPFIAFCTDDRNPLDIYEHGHLDYIIRTAIADGADPLAVYRAASWSAAKAFGLRDRGLIAPGQRADFAVIDSLEGCNASDVYIAGQPVNAARFEARDTVAAVARNSVRARAVAATDFSIPAGNAPEPIIGIVEGLIITEHETGNLPVENGMKMPDFEADHVKIGIVERHGKNGNIAAGFVRGFGLKAGAIASTVCHDHHNIAVVGATDADMAFAANRLSEIEGGFVVVKDGQVLAELALPVAGLMSLEPFESVHQDLVILRDAAKSLGVTLAEPFLQLAFLALPVIPHLKITDHGLVDVDRFEVIHNG